jgi:anti-sigma factor RsiW
MNKDLLNILLNSNKDIDNQQLMDYLAGKLSEEEKHSVERHLAENDFMNDAVEGLENVKNKRDINLFVDQLNRDLHKKLFQKKEKKRKRKPIQQRWIYAAIILILALVIATWLMIVKYQHLRHK